MCISVFARMRRALIGALVASLLCAGAPARAADQKLVVRMDFSAWGMHAAMHLAKQKGWFAQEGLDVVIQDGTGTINTLQLLAAGQVDVGQVQLGTMAVAKERGLNLISIAGFARKGDLAVLVDEKLPLKSARDLAGKKLACFTTSPWVPFIDPFFNANNITKSNADVVMVSPSAMLSTYASGNSDGFMAQAPFGEPMVQKVRPAKSFLLSDSGFEFPSYGLVTTPSRLSDKEGAIRKLVQIEVRAWKYIYEGHQNEAVAAIQAQRPNARLDAKILTDQINAYKPFFASPTQPNLPIGMQADSDWNVAIRSMEKIGLLKPGHKPSDYYTNALVAN
ncbi:Putative thiamine biosynthesis protein [Caballeronia arvi]|uniref:Thiamine pyrimidine synthase n=1 Tax=Caballeronia arvi TaxID=1777135 RepID=A0A158KIY4_9BURK|nr:Putative thiamine biosynthesis protein [Caballeronia arvi]